MASNRQKLDDWVRQERRRGLRDLVLAAAPFAIALGAAWLTWRNPEAGSALVHALTLPDRLLLLIGPALIGIAVLLYASRALRQR